MFNCTMLLGLLRRHLRRLKFFEHHFPMLMVPRHRVCCCVRAEIKIRFQLLLAVASDAVGFDKRPHGAAETALKINLLRGDQPDSKRTGEKGDRRDDGAPQHWMCVVAGHAIGQFRLKLEPTNETSR
jgi:hypothetical protein